MTPSAGRKITRILRSSIVPFAIFSAFCHYEMLAWDNLLLESQQTIAVMLPKSLSGVMASDWTKNLSRHLASGGGSSRIAWRSTLGFEHQDPCRKSKIHGPCTSTSLPTSMRPELGRTQYLAAT